MGVFRSIMAVVFLTMCLLFSAMAEVKERSFEKIVVVDPYDCRNNAECEMFENHICIRQKCRKKDSDMCGYGAELDFCECTRSGPSGANIPCEFPFIFNNETVNFCYPWDDNWRYKAQKGKYWCSTKTDENRNHIHGQGYWGFVMTPVDDERTISLSAKLIRTAL